MDEELDTPPTDDDAAFIWLTSAVQDILSAERPRSEESPETIAVSMSE